MGDNRQHKRLRLEAVDVDSAIVFVAKIEIIDISLGGLSLKADRRLNINCCYVVKLRGKNKTISVKGAIIWSKLSEFKPGPDGEASVVYTAGMKFNYISASTIPDLREFIKDHRKRETVSVNDYRPAERMLQDFVNAADQRVVTVAKPFGGSMIILKEQKREIGEILLQ